MGVVFLLVLSLSLEFDGKPREGYMLWFRMARHTQIHNGQPLGKLLPGLASPRRRLTMACEWLAC